MQNEIKVNEYVRTCYGEIFKVSHLTKQNEKYLFVNELVDRNEDRAENDNVLNKNEIIKHSLNIIDLIECGDYVNGKEVKHIADFEGINKPIKKLIFVDETHLIPGETAENEDIETVVTKEKFESISYKVK